MMVKDVKRTPVRPKKMRRKTLYFNYEKERFRLSRGTKNAGKEKKLTC